MPDHDIFSTGELWFGADAAPESEGWLLTALSVLPIDAGKVEKIPVPSFQEVHMKEDALRNLAHQLELPIHMGATVSLGPLMTDVEYRKIAVREFSIWTPENSMKPQFIHPQREVYAFQDVDALVDIARLNGVDVHGHSLVYHKSSPEWMKEATESELEGIMV